MPQRRPRRLLLALTGTAVLALTACGGSSGGSSTSSGSAGGGSAPAKTVAADPAVAAAVPDAVKSDGKLTVATEGAYPPFEMFDTDGKTLIGVDPELATALAQVMGLKIDLVNVKFDSIIPGLQAKRYDMGMAAFSDTKEREKVVDFVTYFQGGTSLLVPKGNPMKLSLAGLCGKRLAVQKGTIYESDVVPAFQAKCAAAGSPAIVTAVFPGEPETILAVGNGRADVTISDFAPLAYTAKQSSGKFEVLPEQYNPSPWGAVMPKGSGLAEPLRAAMVKLMADGTYQRILQKYDVTVGKIDTPAVNVAG